MIRAAISQAVSGANAAPIGPRHENNRCDNQQFPASKAVGQDSSDNRADERSQQDRADDYFFHARRKRELFS